MRKVYKYEVEQTTWLPENHKILHVAFMKPADGLVESIHIWCEVDTYIVTCTKHCKFHIICTGDPVPENSEYIGTAINDEKTYVLHLYKEKGI